jgi:hypothetical protein
MKAKLKELIEKAIASNTYKSNKGNWTIPHNQIKISITELQQIITHK